LSEERKKERRKKELQFLQLKFPKNGHFQNALIWSFFGRFSKINPLFGCTSLALSYKAIKTTLHPKGRPETNFKKVRFWARKRL